MPAVVPAEYTQTPPMATYFHFRFPRGDPTCRTRPMSTGKSRRVINYDFSSLTLAVFDVWGRLAETGSENKSPLVAFACTPLEQRPACCVVFLYCKFSVSYACMLTKLLYFYFIGTWPNLFRSPYFDYEELYQMRSQNL